MPARMVREITTHRWEVAGPKATPLLGVVTREGPVDLAPRDVATLEVLATALAEATRSAELDGARFAGAPWTRDFVVRAQGGAVDLRLSTAASDGAWEKVDSELDPD